METNKDIIINSIHAVCNAIATLNVADVNSSDKEPLIEKLKELVNKL